MWKPFSKHFFYSFLISNHSLLKCRKLSGWSLEFCILYLFYYFCCFFFLLWTNFENLFFIAEIYILTPLVSKKRYFFIFYKELKFFFGTEMFSAFYYNKYKNVNSHLYRKIGLSNLESFWHKCQSPLEMVNKYLSVQHLFVLKAIKVANTEN